MNCLTKIYIFLAFLSTSQLAIAQPEVDPNLNKKEKSTVSFTVGSTFSSNLHYYGRTDSLKSSALIPNLSLEFGKGFFFNTSFVFINNKTKSFDYTAAIVGAGYKFGESEGLAGNLYADKFFYNNNQLVQSSQTGQAGFALSWLNNVMDLNGGSSVVFSNNADFFASLGLDHPFRIGKENTIFVVTPTVTANAGSQNFTHTYLLKRNIFLLPVADQEFTKTSKQFQLLSYDISVPLELVHDNLSIHITPGYVLPQNVIKVAGRPDLSENASSLFYFNIGASITFGNK